MKHLIVDAIQMLLNILNLTNDESLLNQFSQLCVKQPKLELN